MQQKQNRFSSIIVLATCVVCAVLSFSCGEGGMRLTPQPAEGPPPTASVSTSALNFGTQPIAIISSPQTVTLTNTGNSTLNITRVEVTAASAGSFTQNNTCGKSVTAGDTCRIAVLFTPGSVATQSAALTIADDTATSPHTVALSGKGEHDVILAWSPSPSRGVDGYIVLRTTATRASATGLTLTPIAGTTYVDTQVKAGKRYQYWIRAVSAKGIPQSSDSPPVSATIPSP